MQLSAKKKRKLNQSNDNVVANCSLSIASAAGETSILTSDIDIFYGMTKASEGAYEVWAHEDCVVWSPGVHIIGPRVVGLEVAVWSCVRHQCTICKQYGAIISCLQRNCKEEVHVPCAKRHDWSLNEQNFQCRCSKHLIDTDKCQQNDNND